MQDGFYESPSNGGTNKIERGVQYVEEFATYDACIILARALQREFGKDKVKYQTFSVKNGGEYSYKKGESPAVNDEASKGGKKAGQASVGGRKDSVPGAGEAVAEGRDSVDAEWSKLMNSMKLTSMPGFSSPMSTHTHTQT